MSESPDEKIGLAYPLLMGLLLLTSIIFPPLLLLNLPIMIGRSAFCYWRAQADNKKDKTS